MIRKLYCQCVPVTLRRGKDVIYWPNWLFATFEILARICRISVACSVSRVF